MTVGDSARLVAVLVFPDGGEKSGASGVSWTSSNVSVATITFEGVVTVGAPGEADILVTLEGLGGRAHVTGKRMTYVVRGVVHETAPTDYLAISGASVTVVGGSLDGQSVNTDAAGAFSLPPVTDAGFSLTVTGSRYQTRQVTITTLPGNEALDIALSPEFALRQQTLGGNMYPECRADQGETRSVQFGVHYAGTMTFQEFIAPLTTSGAPTVSLRRNGELLRSSSCPVDCTVTAFALEAGGLYTLEVGASHCIADPPAGTFRVTFTHPT